MEEELDIGAMSKDDLTAELKRRQINPDYKGSIVPRPNNRNDEGMINWLNQTNAMLRRVQEL